MLTIKQLHMRNDLCFVNKILNGSIWSQLRTLFPTRTVPYLIRRPRVLSEFDYDTSTCVTDSVNAMVQGCEFCDQLNV